MILYSAVLQNQTSTIKKYNNILKATKRVRSPCGSCEENKIINYTHGISIFYMQKILQWPINLTATYIFDSRHWNLFSFETETNTNG